MNPSFHSSRQSGFTLVELIIASLIGLMILAVLGSVFLSNKQSYRTQTGVGSLQENGRFAMYFLRREMEVAGFPRLGVIGVTPFEGVAVDGSNGASNGSDTLNLRHAPATVLDTSGVAVPDTNGVNDCVGSNGGNPVVNTFTVSNGALNCNGSGGGSQPLIGDVDSPVVETLQVQYGEDTDADNFANVYRRADQVTNWANVTSVRVSVLINSGEAVGTSIDTRFYAVLDIPAAAPTNTAATPLDERQFARRVFTTTVQIRNRNPG